MHFVESIEVRAHGKDPIDTHLPGRQQHRPRSRSSADPAGRLPAEKERTGEVSPRKKDGHRAAGRPAPGAAAAQRPIAGPSARQRPPSALQAPALPGPYSGAGSGQGGGRAPPAAARRGGEPCPAATAWEAPEPRARCGPGPAGPSGQA